MASLDEALGIQPHQRSSGELQALGCALAVFVPFATAARLLGLVQWEHCQSTGGVWGWVQAAGQQAMETLQKHLHALAQGDLPAPEALAAALAAAPLVLGADGVLVLLRPTVVSRPRPVPARSRISAGPLEPASHAHRQGHHLAAPASAGGGLGGYRGAWPRLWLEAVRQGISTAPRWSGSCDGARGLWRLYEEQLAAVAAGILDFYHAVQYLWKGGGGLAGRPHHLGVSVVWLGPALVAAALAGRGLGRLGRGLGGRELA